MHAVEQIWTVGELDFGALFVADSDNLHWTSGSEALTVVASALHVSSTENS